MERTMKQLPEEIKDSLKEVSIEEIAEERAKGKIGIVLKYGDTNYMYIFSNTKVRAKEREKEEIRYILGSHLCNSCDIEQSGKLCPKIADASADTCKRYHADVIEAIMDSKRIEKYDFIRQGIECFNSLKEYFVVSECSHYILQNPNPIRNVEIDIYQGFERSHY